MVCANESDNTLSVVTNNGRGKFTLSQAVDVGVSPNSVTTADIDCMGSVALICANFGNATLSIATQSSVSVPLTMVRSGDQIIVSWPSSATGFILQTNSNLAPANWNNYVGGTILLQSGNLFFRLKS